MQFSALNGVEYTLKLVERRVPQGNILSPLLFLVFISDQNRSTRFFNLAVYAKYTSLVVTSKIVSELISQASHEIPKITAWFASNKHMIDGMKNKYMIVHSQA